MGILLTPDELSKVIEIYPVKYCWQQDEYKQVARAQLKKAFDEFEKRFFRAKPAPDEITHISYEMWLDFRGDE